MSSPILRLEVRVEHDVVLARQRARQIAGLLGLEAQDQTRVATAVSEIARNAFQYAGGGTVEFLAAWGPPPTFLVRVRDRGPGVKGLQTILDGHYQSATGMGLGIIGVRRLMDRFRIESAPGTGTVVEFGKALPKHAPALTAEGLARVAEGLARQGPQSPFEEVQQQNQELLRALEEVRRQQAELAAANEQLREREAALAQLNRELEDTNRGVVALYAELDEKADFLRRASEMKSRFLSNMSHEFRTPLNAVIGLARLLQDRTDGELTPEQDKQVTLIRRAAEDLTELVNDLLDLAKVEAGKVSVRPNEFDVADLFGALRGMLRPLLAANASVALVFEEPDGLPPLQTDESKVSQILRNFISNALKFTERGEVRVSARPGADDTVVFAVADTGIGIAAEDQERIFEEFTQVESVRQRFVKGTGLGLPLVRRLADLLGGRLELTSAPGVGSTFSAVLPRVYRGPAEVSFVPEVTAQLDPARRPVLVVEDNRETLFIYEKYLKGTIFQAVPARTVRAARQALARFRPAAVVLDVLLEGESTWELLADLKSAETTRDLPVLVVTLVENEAKALALGADAFCAKPVDRAWLLARLNAALRGAASATVLVIDDDEASRYLLRGMLGGAGFDVVEAPDGEEGMRQARRHRPRAIFLDLDLPGRDGLEVLGALRADAATRDLTVIVHTARVLGEEDCRRLTAAGAAAVLPKEQPSREAALARLRDALHAAGLPTEAPSGHA
jgi:signal transduction histidine kinase/CheY-like chemotaxis protein